MGRAVSDRWMLKFAKDWLDMLHSTGGNDISAAQMDQAAAHAPLSGRQARFRRWTR